MNAIIIYETIDFKTGAKATLAEAMAAHLIILAVSHVQSLAQSLFDWSERWGRSRRFQEAALTVRDGGYADKRLAQVPPELAQFARYQFARYHGLSLICDSHAPFGEAVNRCAPTITVGSIVRNDD